jgi:hypothetical protein
MSHKEVIAILIVSYLLLPLVGAVVTCDTIPNINYESGTSTAQQFSFHCTNSLNSNAVTLSSTGSASQYITLSDTVIGQSGNTTATQKTFTLNFNEQATQGDYISVISFSDGSNPLSFVLKVNGTQQVSQGGCQINPSLVSYTQQVQQGTKIPIPKITFSPINCDGQLILTGSTVSIQGGIITTEGQKPVYISSVESDGVTVNIDTEGLNSQTYSSKLKINAYSKQFEIPFTIIITGGTSTSGDFNIENLPACSLTSNVLNTNVSYSMVCTNLVPDVSIEPVVDSKYIIGVGRSSESNQFTWTFRPKNFGNTIIKAQFKYLGVPVGEPFSQEVVIQSSGNPSPGTSLEFVFTPTLDKAKPQEDVIIQLVDNKTLSLVSNPEVFIDALPLTVNNSFFKIKLDIDKNYSIRGRSAGYTDLVKTIALSMSPISLTMTPESGDSRTNFIISTDSNATIYIDGVSKGNYYTGTIPEGYHEIKAFKEGYIDSIKNITIESAISITKLGADFNKGDVQVFNLNKNDSWTVYYQEDSSVQAEIYNNLVGQGTKIEFTPKKAGTYTIRTNNGATWTGTIEPPETWKILGLGWYVWAVGLFVLAGGIWVWKNRSSGTVDTSGYVGVTKY